MATAELERTHTRRFARSDWALVSDLDGTLLGDEDGLRAFSAWVKQHRGRLKLVYNSGRLVDSIAEVIASTALPVPDAIIGGIGTEIRYTRGSRLAGRWLSNVEGWNRSLIESIVSGFDGVDQQPENNQAPYKVSFYAFDASASLLKEMRRRLDQAGCRADLIYSSARDLDFVPRGANKGSAAAFLTSAWSLPPERVVVSGDTGNDLAMFEIGCRGIVVANAHSELRNLEGDHVYHAEGRHAYGVLEGLRQFLGGMYADEFLGA